MISYLHSQIFFVSLLQINPSEITTKWGPLQTPFSR